MTTASFTERKRFRPGTTGWTASDLDDPQYEGLWDSGRYEIVEGVLTRMPPAYYDSGIALGNLIELLLPALRAKDPKAKIPTEIDLIVGERRVPRVDAVYLSPSDRETQKRMNALHGRGTRKGLKYGRILVPPTLVIESLSRGHEDHDRVTKRAWYAEMKVPNYWLLNYFDKSLECLVLEGQDYHVDATGSGDDEVSPSFPPSLKIPLAKVWED